MQFLTDNEKVDYIRIEGNIYTHKQIERRNGITFMRMKKRLLPDFRLNERKEAF